jgi:hypothetical protein
MKRYSILAAALTFLAAPLIAQDRQAASENQNSTGRLQLLAYYGPQDRDHDRDRDHGRDRDHDRDRDWDRDRDSAWHREHRGDWNDAHDRAWHREHERDRAYAQPGYGYGGGAWRGRLSPEDQGRFNSYYDRWMKYRATNNVGEMRSMEGRMRDVYSHYGIPSNVPFGEVAGR